VSLVPLLFGQFLKLFSVNDAVVVVVVFFFSKLVAHNIGTFKKKLVDTS
jgi:hypothetical protein